jgi:hypothetical protein
MELTQLGSRPSLLVLHFAHGTPANLVDLACLPTPSSDLAQVAAVTLLSASCSPLLRASNSLAVRAVETSRAVRSSVRTTSLQFQYFRY